MLLHSLTPHIISTKNKCTGENTKWPISPNGLAEGILKKCPTKTPKFIQKLFKKPNIAYKSDWKKVDTKLTKQEKLERNSQ